MYTPSKFKVEDARLVREFLAAYPFATLIQNFEAAHIPLLEIQTQSSNASPHLKVLYGHLTSTNPLVSHLRRNPEAMAIFLGPHAYVSSSWYSSQHIPPTWNFMSAHLRGRARVIDDEDRTWEIVQATVSWAEAYNQSTWSISGDHPRIRPLRQMIVGVEFEVLDIQCSFKLSQNRSREDRENVIRQLRHKGQTDLARWMERALAEDEALPTSDAEAQIQPKDRK